MKQLVERLLREPLLQFFVVGGLFFFLYANGTGTGQPASNIISISTLQIDRLTAQFSATWNRPPTDKELETIINGYIREEVYYRDALALGLDKNDPVIRQRLRQKMEFLTDTGASLLEPTEAELQAYWLENEETYQRRPRLALEQVFLGQIPTPTHTKQVLQRLQSNPSMNVSVDGARSLLPARLRLSQPEAIDSVFGEGFFNQLKDFPLGMWSGPVVSSYGTHLVRIVDIQPAVSPPLDEIREAVVRDWKAEKALELHERDYSTRLQKYVVIVYGHSELNSSKAEGH